MLKLYSWNAPSALPEFWVKPELFCRINWELNVNLYPKTESHITSILWCLPYNVVNILMHHREKCLHLGKKSATYFLLHALHLLSISWSYDTMVLIFEGLLLWVWQVFFLIIQETVPPHWFWVRVVFYYSVEADLCRNCTGSPMD